jgi:putative ABC transport system substrate-binding protein
MPASIATRRRPAASSSRSRTALSLGRGSIRSAARAGGRSGSSQGDRDCRDRRPAFDHPAKAATTTIPIVFTSGGDPVKLGLVDSLNRPGGNATGVNNFTVLVNAKRVGLLLQLVPAATLIGVLVNPTNPNNTEMQLKELQEAGHSVGKQTRILQASTEGELDTAFATAVQLRVGALLVSADPFFNSRREHIVGLAARHAIPAMYEQREFATAGGLASYGTDFADSYRQAGVYTGRILKGEKPADLPVVQATKFEFVINLKTAKALGLDVPLGLSAGADEVIE